MFTLNSTLFSSSVDKLIGGRLVWDHHYYYYCSHLILPALLQVSILERLVERLTLKVNMVTLYRERIADVSRHGFHHGINTLTTKSIVLAPTVADLKSK